MFDGAPYQRGSSDTRTSSLARTSLGILDDPHTPATALRKRASYRAMDRRDKLPHPRRGLWIPPAPHTVRVLPQVLIRSNMLTATFAPQFETHYTPEPRNRMRLLAHPYLIATPTGRAMAGLLAVFAEFEREIMRERVRAGLEHARRNGQRLGRPKTAALHADQVRQLHRTGIRKAEIARRLRIGRTSVRRILKDTIAR